MPTANATTNIREVLDRLEADETLSTPIPPNRLTKPAFGEPQRDGTASIVDGVVDELCRKIDGVRVTLDKIEQQAVESGARAKGILNEHSLVCIKLNDEITHMGAVVEQIHDMMKNSE